MRHSRSLRLLALAVAGVLSACSPAGANDARASGGAGASDTLGARPTVLATIRSDADRDLVEGSGVVASLRQPGIFFLMNDSGHDPDLFAVDSSGADRGSWRITSARNVDWEALALGACGAGGGRSPAPTNAAALPAAWCVYIGDTGDNGERYALRTIYRIPEPDARGKDAGADIEAQRLDYRYADGPHDVEAMYLAPDGALHLVTKRRRRASGSRDARPALVFTLPASAWGAADTVVAALTDSLPIVPGSGPRRLVTDAALAPDGRTLAVRTYAQLYLFATDPATGRVDRSAPPGICDLRALEERHGEGVTWLADSRRLVLSQEGKRSPLHMVDCPLPRRTTLE